MSDFDRFIPPEVRGLRDGVEAPDLSNAILQEVGRRQGWLSARQRRLLCAARWGAGGVLLGVLAGVLLVERYTPVDEIVTPQPRALADLMQNVRNDASVAVQNVSTQVRSIPEQFMNQSRQIVAATMQRHGNTRVVELAGPAVVVDELTLAMGYVGASPVAGAPGAEIMPAFNTRYRTGVGLSWPASLSAPVESNSPQAPLFQAVGLERSR